MIRPFLRLSVVLVCSWLCSGWAPVAYAESILTGPAKPPATRPVDDPVPARPVPASSAALQDPVFLLSRGGDRSAPVSIRSDLMEATESDAQRTLVFERNVEVRQGDLLLRTAYLEAVYPTNAKQPSRLRARGGVLLREGGREARCTRADYDRLAQRITCSGAAILKDGVDEVRGESIVFDLAARRVTVRGGTQVAVTPREDAGQSSGLLEGLDGEGPVTIRADELQAWETPEGRHLTFGGEVDVEREDLTLRATHIEAFYPPGASEPERLVASGDVRVTQRDREALCDRAEYHRLERRLECRGSARLQQQDDHVVGDVIDFDLNAETLVVTGNTRLFLAPREPEAQAIP